MKNTAGLLLLTLALVSPANAQEFNPVVRISVLSDYSSIYKDNTGEGSLAAAKMAVDDFLAATPNTVCPSSDKLRLIERFSKRGSGSSGFRV